MSGEEEGQENRPLRTARLGLAVRAVQAMRSAALPMVAAWFATRTSDVGFGWIFAAGAAIVIAGGLVAWLQWWRLTYHIGTDSIRVESGVFARQARSVPFERIQDVSVEQTPLPRLLGLAELRFETGAGGKDELNLSFLHVEAGENLRQLVRERREDLQVPPASSGPEGAASPSEDTTVFAMDRRRILTFGLFEFSLVIFGVLLGAAQQFDFLLPFDLWDWGAWRDFAQNQNLAWLGGLGQLGAFAAFVGSVLALAAAGVLTGVTRTVLREWNFRLERTTRGFRRRRGMLTLTDMVLPFHRVQAAILQTGWLRKRWGWHAFKLVSLASDSGSGSSNHVVAPFAKMEEIVPLSQLAAIMLPSAETPWQRPLMRRHMLEAGILSVLVLAAVAILIVQDRGAYWAGLLLIVPLFFMLDWLGWRRCFYALDGQQIYWRKGLLRPKIMIAPQVKLQSASVVRGPLGRLLGFVDLHLGLAGGRMALRGLRYNQAQAIRAQLIESMAAVDFSRLPR